MSSFTKEQQILHETKNFISVMPFKERVYPSETTISSRIATAGQNGYKHNKVASLRDDHKNRNDLNKKQTSSNLNVVLNSTATRIKSFLSLHEVLALFYVFHILKFF